MNISDLKTEKIGNMTIYKFSVSGADPIVYRIISDGNKAIECSLRLTMLPDPKASESAVIIIDQIFTTFKFLDQTPTSPEGQFCGGFAGKICPAGFTCVFDGSYPDAGGKCVKK